MYDKNSRKYRLYAVVTESRSVVGWGMWEGEVRAYKGAAEIFWG